MQQAICPIFSQGYTNTLHHAHKKKKSWVNTAKTYQAIFNINTFGAVVLTHEAEMNFSIQQG